MGCGGSKEKKKKAGPQPVEGDGDGGAVNDLAKDLDVKVVAQVEPAKVGVQVIAARTAPRHGERQDMVSDGSALPQPQRRRSKEEILRRLLPGGIYPPECQFWLNFKKTESTQGKEGKAADVLPWMIDATKFCHLDQNLKHKMRDFMATERLVCNLLFLRQFQPLHDAMAVHLEQLGSRLDCIYKELDLGATFSDAALAKVCTQHPEFVGQRVTQARCIPGLDDPKHFNYDDPVVMDETVALHVLMLVTLAVDEGFQAKMVGLKQRAEEKLGAPVRFAKAPPKSFVRANNKQSSPTDYRFEAKPRSMYNIDVSRNLVSAKDPSQVFVLLGLMNEEFGGYAKLKNLFVLPEQERKDRFHLLSVMMTVCFRAGRTYKDLLADPEVQAKWTDYIDNGMENEPAERWKRHTKRAVEFLRSPHLQDEEVKLMCETQILLDDYTRVRAEMHEPYRMWRAANPTSLYHDFARSASKFAFRDPGSTLINACNRGQADVARRFIDSGVYKVDHCNAANKCTGLYMACVNNHVDVVAMLIELKCDVNAARDTGATPVYIAAERGHTDVLKVLIQAGADVNQARADGWGPVQNGARRDYLDVLEVLIKAGGDVNASSDGTAKNRPLEQAKASNQTKNVAILEAAGAK